MKYGPNIHLDGLIMYYDFLNNKSYIFNNKSNTSIDLIQKSKLYMETELEKQNGMITFNSKQNVYIPNYNLMDLKNLTIDLWFVKGDIQYALTENGKYISQTEQLLKLNINNYSFTLNINFDSSTLEGLSSYVSNIYNLVIVCEDGNINYTINEKTVSEISEISGLNSSEYTNNDFIGKMLSLKIYNNNISINNITKNFKNLKNRKWV